MSIFTGLQYPNHGIAEEEHGDHWGHYETNECQWKMEDGDGKEAMKMIEREKEKRNVEIVSSTLNSN